MAQEVSAVKQVSAVDHSWLTVPLPALNQASLVKGHSTNCQQGKQILPVWVNLPERQQLEKAYFKFQKVHHQSIGVLQVGIKHSPSSNKLKNMLTGPFFCGGGCFCMKVRTPFSPPGKPPTRPPSSLLKSSSSSPSRSSILSCEHDEEDLRYYPSRKRLAKRSQSMLWLHIGGSGM